MSADLTPTTDAPTRERYLTTPRVAEILDLAPRTVDDYRYRDARDGTNYGPPYIRLNGRVLYPESELYAWIQENAERSAS